MPPKRRNRPFALTDFDSVRARASEIAAVTEARIMPPMPVDNSGACNTFANARWLNNAEIALLNDWADPDTPTKQPAEAPLQARQPEQLNSPDVLLDMGEDYLPDATDEDDYRCFVLPAPVENNAFLTAYQVLPGDDRVVHHIIVYRPLGEAAAAAAAALDEAEPGAGYSCFGSPGVSAIPRATIPTTPCSAPVRTICCRGVSNRIPVRNARASPTA